MNNPGSRRNRRQPRTVRRLRASSSGVDVLGVNGGDGTVHFVLSAAIRAWDGAPLPRLLLLPGGAMNTIARGTGVRCPPERALREVLVRRRRGDAIPTVDRDLLRVSADGAPPTYGFIFGTGSIVAFLDAYYATGHPCPATAAFLVVRGIASALVNGRFAASLARRERLRVSTDGDEWPDGSYLAVAAASTPDVGFGFLAFARCLEQPGFFHVVGVTGSLPQLALSVPRIRRGSPWRRRLAQDEVSRALFVEGDAPRFTVDGDLYAAQRAISVETGPGVEILVP